MKDKLLVWVNSITIFIILTFLFLDKNQIGRYVFIPDPIERRPFGVENQEKVFDTQTGTLYESVGSKWEIIRMISDKKLDINSQSEITDTAGINQNNAEPDSISN
jgi:hypothetical protein